MLFKLSFIVTKKSTFWVLQEFSSRRDVAVLV